MRDAGGYSIVTSPGERPVEHDLARCAHCPFIMFMKPGFSRPQTLIFRADGTHYEREAGFCQSCYQHVCPRCDGKDCQPYEKKVDLEEKAARQGLFCS